MWVVADMEAGLEHLSWAGGTLRHVDALLVVAQPGRVALITAARTIALARQLGIPEVALVGNRVTGETDVRRLAGFADEHGVSVAAMVPEDPAFAAADRVGACVLDTAADADGVRAVETLAELLSAPRLAR